MGCARANLHVVRLQKRTAVMIPVLLEFQDYLLKGEHEQKPVKRKKRKAAKFFNFNVLRRWGREMTAPPLFGGAALSHFGGGDIGRMILGYRQL